MGKDLHYSIIKFFKERMNEHTRVISYTEIQHDNEILYRIDRIGKLPSTIVHLSDAYAYTLHDYHSRPSILGSGDFILIARPEAKFIENVTGIAAKDKIGIGKIGMFLSSLHRKDIWT